MLRLTTFGGLALSSDGLERPQPPRRLALLARLAPLGSVGVSRAELLADLWPERDADTARHNLDQLLYELRRSLDASPVTGTATLRLDPSQISADVMDFTSALDGGDYAEAIRHYGGPFLQGFYVQGAPEFERWVEATRDRLSAEHRRALEDLAKHAAGGGAHDEAVRWWRQLATADPLSSRTALGLMRALSDAGDSVGALAHARLYDRVVRTELETAPDPAVMAFADSLRRSDGRPLPPAGKPTPKSTSEPALERPLEAPVPITTAESKQHQTRRVAAWSRRRLGQYAAFLLALIILAYGGRRWRDGVTTLPSILVMPVKPLSGPADRPLAEGMTDQLVSALTSADGSLRVMGPTGPISNVASRGSSDEVRDTAHRLGIATILESSLQSDGSRLRVTVRLVDPATGMSRWARTYDEDRGRVFELEDAIVRSVAGVLRVQLVKRMKRETSNIAAFELYRRAREPEMTRSDSAIHVAIDLLDQAIAIDTGFANAYAVQAVLYATAVWGGDVGPEGRKDAYRHATIAARHALALDDSSAQAHLALAVVDLFGYRLRDAETELDRVYELDPNLHDASGWFATVYQWTGRTREGVAEARRNIRDDPLSAAATAELAHAFYFDRQYDSASAEIAKVMALRPPLRRAAQYRAEVLLAQRKWSEAVAALRPPMPQLPRVRALLGYALARSGERIESKQILEELRAGISTGKGSAFLVAEVYAGLGDLDSAYRWLDGAIGDYSLLPAVMGPAFDDLRGDHRFMPIRRRLGLDER